MTVFGEPVSKGAFLYYEGSVQSCSLSSSYQFWRDDLAAWIFDFQVTGQLAD